MPFDASFVNHLEKFAKLEKSFQQSEGVGHMGNAKLSQKVEGGYCFGACAAWLTQALDKEKPTEVDHTSTPLVWRMAKGAVKYDKQRLSAAVMLKDRALANSSARYEQIEEQRQKEMDAASDEAFNALEVASQTYVDSYSRIADLPQYRLQMDKVKAVLQGTLDDTRREINARKVLQKQQAQTKADLARAVGPTEVTVEMIIKLAWKNLQRAEATNYTAALTPVVRVDGGRVNSVADFVCELLQAPAFSNGRGMIVNFSTGAAATVGVQASVYEPAGHAVALHRIDAENFWLFEPNLGVYRVVGRKKLMYALVLIMADGYNKRHLRDDGGVIFCKTSQTFIDQGDPAVDASVLEDRDWVKAAMALVLEDLASKAKDAGLNALKVGRDQCDDQKAVLAANRQLQDAFLHARLTQSSLKPSEVFQQLESDLRFLKNGGRVEDTGLRGLRLALNDIF